MIFVPDTLLIAKLLISPPLATSDHNTIAFGYQFGDLSPKIPPSDSFTTSEKVYNFNNADWKSFHGYLCSIDWVHRFSKCISVNDYWECFYAVIVSCMDNFVRFKCVNTGTSSKRLKPSKINYPAHVKKLINRKLATLKLYARFKTRALKEKFSKIALLCKQAINDNMASSENRLIEQGNIRNFYKYVNSKSRSTSGVASLIGADGKSYGSDLDKAKILNSAFSSVFTIDNGLLPSPPVMAAPSSPHTGLFCTPELVRKTIRKMKDSKSTSEDKLPIILFKKLSSSLSFPLSMIFNISLSTSELPSAWKSAIVVPIYKKGPSSDPLNYRPISLTSSVCKIIETLMKENLLCHLFSNKLISKHQYGFLAKRSTTTQLLDCFSDWVHNFAKKTPN